MKPMNQNDSAPEEVLYNTLPQALLPIKARSGVFGLSYDRSTAILQALRPQQWVKNILIFIPFLLAHQSVSIDKIVLLMLAFVAFSVCASAVYVLNDLVDVESDRQHPIKCRRPFASGDLPLAVGPPIALGLLGVGGCLSFAFLPGTFVVTLVLYVLLTTAYSLWLKRQVMMDVLTLASLYTLRIFAGGASVTIMVSEWLMAFSLFFFMSLALAKRYAELARLNDEGQADAVGRGYRVSDLGLIESMGPTSGSLAVLVFALYINSDAIKQFYTNTQVLWFICPLFLYWLGRIWFLAKRRELSEDPVVFAMKDSISLIIGLVTVTLVMLAAYHR